MNSGEVKMRPMHAESFTGCGGLKHQRDMNLSRYISKGVLSFAAVYICYRYGSSVNPFFLFRRIAARLPALTVKLSGCARSRSRLSRTNTFSLARRLRLTVHQFRPRRRPAGGRWGRSTSSAVSASNNFFPQQNRDLGVAEVPQNPAGKVCLFYGC